MPDCLLYFISFAVLACARCAINAWQSPCPIGQKETGRPSFVGRLTRIEIRSRLMFAGFAAGVELSGLEPKTTEPKSAVLPLHHSSIRRSKALQIYHNFLELPNFAPKIAAAHRLPIVACGTMPVRPFRSCRGVRTRCIRRLRHSRSCAAAACIRGAAVRNVPSAPRRTCSR